MNNQNNLLINVSVLYRYTQKFFDKNLARYNLGSGQMIFLLLINEHEGITMQQLTAMGDFDKGTTSKGIQKLIDEGYVEVVVDEQDKRVRRLYTTKKTGGIINDLYRIRNECCNQLLKNVGNDGEGNLQQMTNNAREIAPEETFEQLHLGGIQKLTLLDYPGQVAATIFTVGCNLKCPFCHNRDLVFVPENFEYLPARDVLDYLEKRQGILDAICITGGEPLLQKGLTDFIREAKNLGYKVKLDTNGFFPEKLEEIVGTGMIDYVAMDIKNSFEKYALTTGMPQGSLVERQARRSINFLMKGNVDYEFRTTVVRELHDPEDLVAIAKMIRGAKRYFLQKFVDSGKCIEEGYSAYSDAEMVELCSKVQQIIPGTQLRGV